MHDLEIEHMCFFTNVVVTAFAGVDSVIAADDNFYLW
jgi:hypothetical protein